MLYLVAQACLTLRDPTDCNPPGSSVHGDSPGKNTGVGCHVLLQGISPPRDQTLVSHIAGRLFAIWATREARYCRLEWKLVQSFWRTAWRFLKKLKVELLYYPAIPFLGIYVKKDMAWKHTCTPEFTAGLLTIANTWKKSILMDIFLNRGMGKENVVLTYNGMLLSHLEE